MFTNILLPVDLDQESSWERALPAAVEVSQKAGARLHVMTVVPDYGMSIVGSFFPENYEAKALENAAAALHTFVQAHVPKRIQVRHVVGDGKREAGEGGCVHGLQCSAVAARWRSAGRQPVLRTVHPDVLLIQ